MYILSSYFWRSFQEKALWKTESSHKTYFQEKKKVIARILTRLKDVLGKECMAAGSSTVPSWAAKDLNMALAQSPEIQKIVFPYELHNRCVF